MPDGSKRAIEDFASLLEKTSATDGTDYKYTGNYLDLFKVMQQKLPDMAVEMPKLFKLLFLIIYSAMARHTLKTSR